MHEQPQDMKEAEKVLDLLRRMGLIQPLGIDGSFGYNNPAAPFLNALQNTDTFPNTLPVNPYSAQPQLLERMLGGSQGTNSHQGIYSPLAGGVIDSMLAAKSPQAGLYARPAYTRPAAPLAAYLDTCLGLPAQKNPYSAFYQQKAQPGVGLQSNSLTPRSTYSPVLVSYSGYSTPRACGVPSYGGKACGGSCSKGSGSAKGGK